MWARRVRVRFDYPGYPTEQPQEGFARGVRKYVRVTVLEHGRMYMYVPTCAGTSMQVGVGECGKKISCLLQRPSSDHPVNHRISHERERSVQEKKKRRKGTNYGLLYGRCLLFLSSATETQKRETRQGGNGELTYDKGEGGRKRERKKTRENPRKRKRK